MLSQPTFAPSGTSGRVFLRLGARIRVMHDLYLTMGDQSLRAGQSIFSGPCVLIVLAVTNLKREFLVGLNEAGHRCQKFGIGGG